MTSISDWDKIEISDEFQTYQPREQSAIKSQWFKENIVPSEEFQAYGEDDQVKILNSFAGRKVEIPKPDRSLGEIAADIPRSLARGLDSAAESVGRSMEMMNIPGGKQLADYYGERAQRPEIQKPAYLREGTVVDKPERLVDLSWWVNALGENLPNMALMMAPGAAAFRGAKALGAGAKAAKMAGTVGAGAGAFSIESGSAYNQAKQDMLRQGYDEKTADGIATAEGVTVGLVNSLLEAAPFGVLLHNPGGKKILARVVRQGLLEGGTEAVQENVQMLAAKLGHGEDKELKDWIGQTVESGLIGSVLGGGAGVFSGADVQPEKPTEKSPIQEDVPPKETTDLGDIPGPDDAYWDEQEAEIKRQRREGGLDRKDPKQQKLEEAWQKENAEQVAAEETSPAVEATESKTEVAENRNVAAKAVEEKTEPKQPDQGEIPADEVVEKVSSPATEKVSDKDRALELARKIIGKRIESSTKLDNKLLETAREQGIPHEALFIGDNPRDAKIATDYIARKNFEASDDVDVLKKELSKLQKEQSALYAAQGSETPGKVGVGRKAHRSNKMDWNATRMQHLKKMIAEKAPKAAEKVKEPWESSDLAQAPNIPIDRVQAKKRPDGKWKLLFRGTRNEVFPEETFGSAKEAKDFFKVQQIKAQDAVEIDRRQASRNTNGILSGKGKNGKKMKPVPKGENVKGVVVEKPTLKEIHEAQVRGDKNFNGMVKAYGPNFGKEYRGYLKDMYGDSPMAKSYFKAAKGEKLSTIPQTKFTPEDKRNIGIAKGKDRATPKNPPLPKSTGEMVITAKRVADSFTEKGFRAKRDGDTVTVSTPTGKIEINVADSIVEDDSASISVSYGRQAKPGEKVAGSYYNGKIKLKRDLADSFTLYHESVHHMKEAGLFNPREERMLAKIGDEEAQARWVEKMLRKRDSLKGYVAQLVQKIVDFADALVNVFVRTERGILRDVESKKILKRKGGNQAESALQLATKKLTDTPAFKRWFGDSKVVDENGEPLVVYHGTTEEFDSFDIKKTGLRTGNKYGEGAIFFTSNPKAASAYALPPYSDPHPHDKPSVFPVFLSLKKPLIIDALDGVGRNGGLKSWVHFKDRIAQAQKGGYDGVILKNVLDHASAVTAVDEGAIDTYIAFSPTQIKSATGNSGAFDPNNPDIRYSTKTEGFEYAPPETSWDRAKMVFERTLNDFMYWVVDKNRPIQTVQNQLSKVTDKINVFLKETQRTKITAARIAKAWEDEINPLIEKMARYKIELPDLELYAHALHAPEANDALRKSNAKLQVEKIVGVLGKKEAKAVKDSVHGVKEPADWLNHLEEILDEYGEHEDVKLIKAKWEKFAEKPSGMTDGEAKEILAKHKGDNKIEELRKMLSQINQNRLDILFEAGQLPKEEYDVIRNKYKYYVPLYREGYNDSLFGSSRGLKPSGRQIKVRGGSTRNVVNIFAHTVANYEKAINVSEKAVSQRALHGLVTSNLDSELIEIEPVKKSPRYDKAGNLRMYPDLFNVGDNEMRLMVGGKQYLVSVQRDNKDAMLMMRTLKAEDGMSGPIVNFLAKINRILARINTTWSPEFIVSNFVRDIQTAGINIQDTGVKGEKMFTGAIKSWKAIWAVERGKRRGTPEEKLYDRFRAAGGKIGWSDVHGSVTNLSKKINAEIKMAEGKRPTRKTIKRWLNLIEDANTSIENGVRLHAFKLAVEQGKSDERAAQIASDLTVDFTKKGAAGPVINSLYLFANAGIQGSYRIIRAASKSGKVQATLAGIVGTSFLVGLLNSMAGTDEDGEDYFNKIDDFVRERNMIFMIPGTKGKYVKIPAPWGYNLFWNIGSEMSRAVTKETYDPLSSAGRLMSIFVNAFNPVASGTLLQTLSPTVSDPFVQVSENKNWFGGDLMPSVNKFERVPTPDSQRYWQSASSGSKWIASTLNSITGGDKVKAGLVDVSPETLDLIVDTAGGSALRFFKDSFGVPLSAIRKEEIEMHKIPFARRVAGGQPAWANSRIYYENVENILIAKDRLKTYKGTDRYKNLLAATVKERRLIPVAERSEKELRKLRKLLKKAKVRGNKQTIENIKKRMDAVYNRFNSSYNKTLYK